MANVSFGFGEIGSKPVIEVQTHLDVLAGLRESNPDFEPDALLGQVDRTIVRQVTDDGTATFQFDFGRAWRYKNARKKLLAIDYAALTLTRLVNISSPDDDIQLSVRTGSQRSPDGRLHMLAEVRWPAAPVEAVAELATAHMRSVALDLRYPDIANPQRNKRQINDLVYARLNREHGVELQTNPMGSCSLDTLGDLFEPEDPTFEVMAHNIYNRDQQIICLAGAIAIARADDLLKLG